MKIPRTNPPTLLTSIVNFDQSALKGVPRRYGGKALAKRLEQFAGVRGAVVETLRERSTPLLPSLPEFVSRRNAATRTVFVHLNGRRCNQRRCCYHTRPTHSLTHSLTRQPTTHTANRRDVETNQTLLPNKPPSPFSAVCRGRVSILGLIVEMLCCASSAGGA